MKVTEVHLFERVPEGGPGAYTQMLRVEQGWSIECDYEHQVLVVSRGLHRGVVPFSNVKWFVFAPPAAPAVAELPKLRKA